MKKIYILAAIALVAGVSCTKQVPADNNSPDVPISFSPFSYRVGTKANYLGEQLPTYMGTNDAGATYEDFTAWAYFTKEASTTTNPLTNTTPAAGSAFFDQQKAIYDATYDAWKLENAAYWPKDGYLHFHAFSPNNFSPASGSLSHVWGSANTPKGFTLTNYVAPVYVDADTDGLTNSNQVDVLYSNFVYDKQRSGYNPLTGLPYDDDDDSGAYKHKGVDITFNHALAAVQFKIKTQADYKAGTQKHTFTVKKIEVLNVLNKGTFVENRAATLDNAFLNAVGTTAITKNKDNALTTSPYWTPEYDTANEKSYTVYSEATGSEATYTLSDQIGTTILPVPQALIHPTTNNKVQVKVTFDYVFNNNGTEYSYSGLTSTLNLGGKLATQYAGTDDPTYAVDNWLINHKYVYVLNFKLDEIIFDPMVEAYVLVDGIGVDLPYQN